MEWHDGVIPLADNPSTKPDWSMIVAGDWAPTAGHITSIERSPDQLYGDLLPVIKQADLSVVNLECVLADEGKTIIKDGPAIKAPPSMANGLTVVPFNLICLANNHIMDYGQEGLRATLNTLQAHQLPAIGAGLTLNDATKPFMAIVKGVRVSVLNTAEGEEAASTGVAGVAPLNLAYLGEQIARLRSGSDVIIVIAHAGREILPFPPPYVQNAYHALIDAGADVVVAHHPHTAQGVEKYKEGFIAYSLGNFAFLYGHSYFWSQVGYMLQLDFAGSKLHSATIIPYRILDEGLMALQGTDKTAFLDELKKFSDILDDPHKVNNLWDAYADIWLQYRFNDETNDWVASLLPAETLIRATTSSLGTLTGIRGRIIRRSLAWFEGWLRRANGSAQPLTERQKHGAAILRNRFNTLAHRELHLTALDRMTTNKVGTADKSSIDMLQNWFSRTKL